MSCGLVLVLAVRRRPDLRRVARVHVQDPALAAAAERHPAASVEHDDGGCVDHLRGVGHDDGDRVRPAVEGDDPAVGDRIDDSLRRAARWGAGTDHDVGMRGVDWARLVGQRHACWIPRTRERQPSGEDAGRCRTVDLRHGGTRGSRLGERAAGALAAIGHRDPCECDERDDDGRSKVHDLSIAAPPMRRARLRLLIPKVGDGLRDAPVAGLGRLGPVHRQHDASTPAVRQGVPERLGLASRRRWRQPGRQGRRVPAAPCRARCRRPLDRPRARRRPLDSRRSAGSCSDHPSRRSCCGRSAVPR